MMSEMMRSGRLRSRSSSAGVPPGAASTRKPETSRRSCTPSRSDKLSSTTRINSPAIGPSACLAQGEVHRERAPLSHRARYFHLTPVELEDLAHDGQAQAAARDVVRPRHRAAVEAIEDVGQVFIRYSTSPVFDGN